MAPNAWAIRLRPRGRSGSPARRWVRGTLVFADTGAMLLAMAAAGSWSPAAWLYGGAVLISLGVSGAYQPRICLQALPELPGLSDGSRCRPSCSYRSA
jgi:hypothetical protein